MKIYTAEEELDEQIKQAKMIRQLILGQRNENRIISDIFYRPLLEKVDDLVAQLERPTYREKMKQIDEIRNLRKS